MTHTDTLVRPADTAAVAPTITKKGWFTDPTGQHKLRFHDGSKWTTHATHFGPVPCLGCGRNAS